MKKVLTIAGSDSSGGAGIQADIKTMTMHGVYAMSAITALTAQNTTGVRSIYPVTPDFLAQQIDMVFEDIRPDAVKIGMVSSPELAEVIAERLVFYRAENIVTDPVAVATSGSELSTSEAYEIIKKKLFPISRLITPNIPETELISGMRIESSEDMEKVSEYISEKYNCAVMCKGGHCKENADDFLFSKGRGVWFKGKRLTDSEIHGTGCTLSSAIASNFAKGYSIEKSIQLAKAYISDCIDTLSDIGHGCKPLNHMKGVLK
ncbi:MAG: bifunctional hydroxymethylpyrimidine kinase/phosphomethylpyrimidine kinase [Ruminococcus flavefaciens]|nr:bifunctional hydroxymethylpyrimidine kinase/phosphomethylpyrimidine kinase [Ruminococcus flavefaciens]